MAGAAVLSVAAEVLGGAAVGAVLVAAGWGMRRAVRRWVRRRWLMRVRARQVPRVALPVVEVGVLPVVRSRVAGERVVWPVSGVDR